MSALGRRAGASAVWRGLAAAAAAGVCLFPFGTAAQGPGNAAGQWSGAAATEAWLQAPALHGLTGLINTPTAYTLPSGALRVGVGWYDKDWAYHARGLSDNYHYYLTFGFISRVEVSVRASYFPDDALRDAGPDEKGTVDRGGSGRIQVLTEARTRPAVAVGVDDVRGTRRFHALYAVGSKTFSAKSDFFRMQVSAGYGSDVVDAKTYVLDGVFGGAELAVGRYGSLALDYDTEKWNTSLRIFVFRHVAASFALLHLESPAGGVSWTHQF